MANPLGITNGIPRGFVIGTLAPIYEGIISIVASGGNGSTSLNGPITSGTAITLPSSGSYTLNTSSIANIYVELNGQRLEQNIDWNTSGSSPYTAIQFTFQLVVGDSVLIRSERAN